MSRTRVVADWRTRRAHVVSVCLRRWPAVVLGAPGLATGFLSYGELRGQNGYLGLTPNGILAGLLGLLFATAPWWAAGCILALGRVHVRPHALREFFCVLALVSFGTGVLGATMAECRLLADDWSFEREARAHGLQSDFVRSRWWPWQNADLLYDPVRGFRSTD